MVFSQVLQSYRKEGRSKALFIIRYEGHVDLVTAHKPHFEIVETLLLLRTAKLSSLDTSLGLCSSFSIVDDKDVTIV